MIALLWNNVTARRTARTFLAVSLAIFALAMSLPNLYSAVHPASGAFNFFADNNVVIATDDTTRAAGMQIGDRIDYPSMRPEDRYGDPSDGLRLPPMGHRVTFALVRGNRHLTATLSPVDPGLGSTPNLFDLAGIKAAFFVLVVLSCALVLVRPSPVSWAFFLFVVGNARVLPYSYSFVSGPMYALIMAANDALAAVGPVGYALLALYLGSNERSGPPWLRYAAAAFLCIAWPVAASDIGELLTGIRPIWPFFAWAGFIIFGVCYATGVVAFARTAILKTTHASVRTASVLLAIVGVLTLIGSYRNAHSDPWYFANLPLVTSTRALSPDIFWSWFADVGFGARLIASVLVVYMVVHDRIVDAGPVYGRIAYYVIGALASVAIIASINVAFQPQLSAHPIAIPLEVIFALAVGYWASGLRDVAGAVSLAMVDAPNAWGRGDVIDERDMLSRALGLAERARQPGLAAEMRAHSAFSAWRQGDDREMERQIAALESIPGTPRFNALRGFLSAARSTSGDVSPNRSDTPEWRSRSALITCARTQEPRLVPQLAGDAVVAANLSGSPSLQVLALIELAESVPDQRDAALERAQLIARDAGWPALSKSILALRAGARDLGVLEPFIDVRLRKRRSATPMFEISFFNAELRANGSKLPLPEKELELLLSVASQQSPAKDEVLMDALWPESDGDAARNAFRVCLHRLRKDVGDSRIVIRSGRGYTLHPWADVDLWSLRSAIAACDDGGGRDRIAALRALCDAVDAGAGARAAVGDWFLRFERLLEDCLEQAESYLEDAAQAEQVRPVS